MEVKNDPQWYSDKELAADVEKRRTGLLALAELPVVSESGQEATDPAHALAAAGWEAIGRSEDHDFFRCYICLRTHIVQAFSHGPHGPPEELPPAKKRKLEAPSSWTPEIRATSPAAAVVREAERGWFDPHAMHHYYCPLFCHPEETGGNLKLTHSWFSKSCIYIVKFCDC